MKNILVSVIVLTSLCCSFAVAQKNRAKPKPKGQVVSIMEGLGDPGPDFLPQIKSFAYVLDIDENSNISLSVRNSEDTNYLTNATSAKPLTKFFSENSAARSNKNAAQPQPIIMVTADPSLSMGAIADVIIEARNASKMRIKLESGFGEYLAIPDWRQSPVPPRPNPLLLVVNVDKGTNIKLNNGDEGKLSDPKKLEKTLRDIYQARAENGIFREGTNEVETTIFIRTDRSIQFKDVIMLIDTLRVAGAKMIGLDVDVNMENRPFSILETS